MTFQDIYTLFYNYRLAILLAMLFAPWIALGICIAVPGDKEEPFVLNFNLSMAIFSLMVTIGYLWYAASTAGLSKIIQEADVLLILAPCYYVGISLWITRQRLPLAQIPIVRIVQGAALVGAGYLGLAWVLGRLRVVLFSFIPFELLILFLLGLLGLAYLGYLRLTGKDISEAASGRSPTPDRRRPNPPHQLEQSIDEELEAIRRDLDNK